MSFLCWWEVLYFVMLITLRRYGRSRGTVVNTCDITTCPSWVQQPFLPIYCQRKADLSHLYVHQPVKDNQDHEWALGHERNRPASHRCSCPRRNNMCTLRSDTTLVYAFFQHLNLRRQSLSATVDIPNERIIINDHSHYPLEFIRDQIK